MARPAELLKITVFADYTQITFLRDCTVRWSTDTVTWHDMGTRTEGFLLRDDGGGQQNPERSYMAIPLDGGPSLTYWSRQAGLAFADLMEPWFPSKRKEG